VEKTLRDFRLAGVDKDDATRTKVKALREEIVQISQEFQRNIRANKRTVSAANAAELDGLPADYIERHKPGTDGTITLTTEYPDAVPVFYYAKNEDLRKRMFTEYNNRAYPANIETLQKLIRKRAELAQVLGYSSYAELITADKMVGSGKNAAAMKTDTIAPHRNTGRRPTVEVRFALSQSAVKRNKKAQGRLSLGFLFGATDAPDADGVRARDDPRMRCDCAATSDY
jgi:thimet oligopeptidase